MQAFCTQNDTRWGFEASMNIFLLSILCVDVSLCIVAVFVATHVLTFITSLVIWYSVQQGKTKCKTILADKGQVMLCRWQMRDQGLEIYEMRICRFYTWTDVFADIAWKTRERFKLFKGPRWDLRELIRELEGCGGRPEAEESPQACCCVA